jgi:2-hydroxychromene-2-carboxylate isomerase
MEADDELRQVLARRLSPVISGLVTGPRVRDARRAVAETVRRVLGRPHEIDYFHQVDDPYSELAAQVLGRLVDRYDVLMRPYLVRPPADEAAPERALLEAFARKDAADVAPAYGLAFPRLESQPAPELAWLAARMLAGAGREAFVARAADVGHALWSGDGGKLQQMASGLPPADEELTASLIAEGTGRRRRFGHYLGATFHYGGEWYWGVDRLHYLEARLSALGAARARAAGPIVAPPVVDPSPSPHAGAPLVLEFFPSLRSPYSYLAMERVFALPARHPVEVRIRPVLPMVMRGLPVPLAKRLYILRDAKREADRLGIPFGRISDPVGRPIERAFGLYRWARAEGRAADFLLAFCRAAMGEGIDLGSDAGLRRVVEDAGLSWEAADAHGEDAGWREELEENRRAMFAAGLWGVPSFRLLGRGAEPDFCTWGQDRIWLVEQEIRRRVVVPA